jgi:hypothetical protein
MHQYISVTSRTLFINSNDSGDSIWREIVPRLAFGGATYLADAILAVAALHLRSTTPDDMDVVRASHAYMASSLADYCALLKSGINEQNAEALFLTGTLIAFQSAATRMFGRDEIAPKDPNNQYTLPMSWFHSFQGVKTLVATSWRFIRNSGIVLPIIDSQPVLRLDLDAGGPSSFFGHLLQGLDEEIGSDPSEAAISKRNSYRHAVAVLNWAHKIPHRGGALAFPATVSRRYVELLKAQEPRALAILACFFALLKSVDFVWWLQGVSRREVLGIASLFEPTSPWWSHLQWPLRIALYDGTIIPPDIWGTDWVAEENQLDLSSHSASVTVTSHIEALVQLEGQPDMIPAMI